MCVVHGVIPRPLIVSSVHQGRGCPESGYVLCPYSSLSVRYTDPGVTPSLPAIPFSLFSAVKSIPDFDFSSIGPLPSRDDRLLPLFSTYHPNSLRFFPVLPTKSWTFSESLRYLPKIHVSPLAKRTIFPSRSILYLLTDLPQDLPLISLPRPLAVSTCVSGGSVYSRQGL